MLLVSCWCVAGELLVAGVLVMDCWWRGCWCRLLRTVVLVGVARGGLLAHYWGVTGAGC